MWVIHCESGKRALLEDGGVLTYWVRHQDFWVPDDSPFFRWTMPKPVLRPITCVHCDRERPAGREPCPHCGGEPLAHKQTPEEFQAKLREHMTSARHDDAEPDYEETDD